MMAMAGILALTFSVALVGCSSEHEEAIESLSDLMNEMADRLAKIKNNTDLVDAKPDLERLAARMTDQMDKANKREKPTAEEETKLKEKYKTDMERANARLQDEIDRIAKDIGPDVSKLLRSYL